MGSRLSDNLHNRLNQTDRGTAKEPLESQARVTVVLCFCLIGLHWNVSWRILYRCTCL